MEWEGLQIELIGKANSPRLRNGRVDISPDHPLSETPGLVRPHKAMTQQRIEQRAAKMESH